MPPEFVFQAFQHAAVVEHAVHFPVQSLLESPAPLDEPKVQALQARTSEIVVVVFEELRHKEALHIAIPGLAQHLGEAPDFPAPRGEVPSGHALREQGQGASQASGSHPHAVKIFGVLGETHAFFFDPHGGETLEDRMRTRFEWGLTTDIQPPELETRIAILRKKAAQDRLAVPGANPGDRGVRN